MHTSTLFDTVGVDASDALALPCPQALLAAVVALMSAYANPAPDATVDLATHRRLLARKVVSNLFFLREHPAVPAPLRRVMGQAHAHWALLAAGPLPAGDAGTPPRWH